MLNASNIPSCKVNISIPQGNRKESDRSKAKIHQNKHSVLQPPVQLWGGQWCTVSSKCPYSMASSGPHSLPPLLYSKPTGDLVDKPET